MSVGYLKKCSSGDRPKKRYDTQAQAEAHRSALIAAGKWKASDSNAYFCNQCGGYHVGAMGANNRGGGRKPAKNTPRHLASQ